MDTDTRHHCSVRGSGHNEVVGTGSVRDSAQKFNENEWRTHFINSFINPSHLSVVLIHISSVLLIRLTEAFSLISCLFMLHRFPVSCSCSTQTPFSLRMQWWCGCVMEGELRHNFSLTFIPRRHTPPWNNVFYQRAGIRPLLPSTSMTVTNKKKVYVFFIGHRQLEKKNV